MVINLMAIWYKCDNRNKKYLKFIIFNSGKVKLVNNNNIKKITQCIQVFQNGEDLLDALLNLFELHFIEFAELANWILENY